MQPACSKRLGNPAYNALHDIMLPLPLRLRSRVCERARAWTISVFVSLGCNSHAYGQAADAGLQPAMSSQVAHRIDWDRTHQHAPAHSSGVGKSGTVVVLFHVAVRIIFLIHSTHLTTSRILSAHV